MCPHGAYTSQGPQGSINVRIALECLNTAPNLELFRIYACICTCKACENCLSMELNVMKVIEVDLIVV